MAYRDTLVHVGQTLLDEVLAHDVVETHSKLHRFGINLGLVIDEFLHSIQRRNERTQQNRSGRLLISRLEFLCLRPPYLSTPSYTVLNFLV